MHFLKQSTASQIVPFGPFVDDTDFKTAETGLTIANTDIKIVQAGAATSKNSGGATHRAFGEYEATFDATDTATVGRADIVISVSGALIVKKEVTILEEAVYDAFFAASATGAVPIASGGITTGSFAAGAINAAAIADAAIDAATYATDVLELLGVIARGTAGNVTASGTTVVLTGLDFGADTNIVGATVKLRATGTGKAQTRVISAWVNSTATATVDRAWTSSATAPTFDLYAGSPSPTTPFDVNMATTSAGAITNASFAAGAIDNAAIAADAIGSSELAASAIAEIAAGVVDLAISGHTTAGTVGEKINSAASAGDPWSTALPGAYGSGSAGNIVGNQLPAVKTKTDSLTFTVSGMVDSNVIDWKGATAPAMTGDAFARLGAPAGASISADLAALLTTAMTEAYAADGATMTMAQAMYMIWSMLAEATAVGTVLTCKKKDGTTTSMTFTLNDATTPTGITRAT